MRVAFAILAGAGAGVGVALPVRYFAARHRDAVQNVQKSEQAAHAAAQPVKDAPEKKPDSHADEPKPEPVYIDGIVWSGARARVFLTNGREIPSSQVRAMAWDGIQTKTGEVFFFRPKAPREAQRNLGAETSAKRVGPQ